MISDDLKVSQIYKSDYQVYDILDEQNDLINSYFYYSKNINSKI